MLVTFGMLTSYTLYDDHISAGGERKKERSGMEKRQEEGCCFAAVTNRDFFKTEERKEES